MSCTGCPYSMGKPPPMSSVSKAPSLLRRLAKARELAHFIGIVGDEQAYAELQRVGDVLLALDRVAVNAALGRYAQALHQLHLAARGQIEETALGDDRLHDRRMGHGLQRVVQIDSRQRLAKLAELHAHALAVEDQERRAELADEAPNLRGLERVDESRAAHQGRLRQHCHAAGAVVAV